MDCIPSALVRTDWSALAAWAAAAANVAVVWAAFKVQQKQAVDSQKLIEGQHIIAAANGVLAISKAVVSLKKGRAVIESMTDDSAEIQDELQRRSRVMDFFLNNPMADFRTLELLIEIQGDVSWMLGLLKTYASNIGDDDMLKAPVFPKSDLTARSDRWDLVHAEIVEKAKTFVEAAA